MIFGINFGQDMKKYTITLNETQIRLIAECLEEHSRMMCGQLEYRHLPALSVAMHKELDFDKYLINRDIVNYHLKEIKKLIWENLDANANYGIGYDQESDLAYDMYKEIKHTFEKEEQKECSKNGKKYHSNVHTSQPYSHTDEPRIEIEVQSERLLKLKRILS